MTFHRSSRKRSRAVLLGLSTLAPVVVLSLSPQAATMGHSHTTTTNIPTPLHAPLHPRLYENEDLDEEDEVYDSSILDSLSTYRELQKSTGSEVLETELQRQIDDAVDSPNVFLENLVEDATFTEKIAMGSVTEQLPQRAVRALSSQQRKDNLGHAKNRVTVEQEIELARMIQKGANLEAVRDELAEKIGRELSRLEWANAANLSTKELRRTISSYRQAKHQLVTANLGLVHAVVNQQWPAFQQSGISKAELIQEGSLGLIRAAELFDPERGLRFSTYAVVWIKGTLSNSHVPELVRLPSREKTRWNKIQKAQNDFKDAEGVTPTIEDISSATGLTIAAILNTQRSMQKAKTVLSLDMEIKTQSRSGGESSSLTAFSSDKSMQDDSDLAVRTQLKLDVISALAKNLDAREARLVRLRYGLSDGQSRSLAQCAEAMGLSQTRVQQLAKKALDKLRRAVEVESLEEYLLTIA